ELLVGERGGLDSRPEGIEAGGRLSLEHPVDLGREELPAVPTHEAIDRLGVKLAARDAQLLGQTVGGLEERIRNRNRGLHARSITRFIPLRSQQPSPLAVSASISTLQRTLRLNRELNHGARSSSRLEGVRDPESIGAG